MKASSVTGDRSRAGQAVELRWFSTRPTQEALAARRGQHGGAGHAKRAGDGSHHRKSCLS